MIRIATHVPLIGDKKTYQAKAQGSDPKSAQYSDYAIAQELAKRVVALPGELIIVSGSTFRVEDDFSLKSEA